MRRPGRMLIAILPLLPSLALAGSTPEVVQGSIGRRLDELLTCMTRLGIFRPKR